MNDKRTSYAHPETLASIDWALEHLDDPKVKLVEVSISPEAYDSGHISGATCLSWETDLQHPLVRDVVGRDDFARLVGERGIAPDDTVIIYGDSGNWFAAYGFWVFKYYRHRDVRLLNGGRARWLADSRAALVSDVPEVTPVTYEAQEADESIRITLPEVLKHLDQDGIQLVDVRSPDEYLGRLIAPIHMKETAQRAGHIPGAVNIPWPAAVGNDGTFLPPDRLARLYEKRRGLSPDRPTVTYCRIGERSSFSWFVLKYLLGFDNVRNYDGSWTEYGSAVGLPIERGRRQSMRVG